MQFMKKYLLLTILLLSGMAMMADDVEKLDASKITRISSDYKSHKDYRKETKE